MPRPDGHDPRARSTSRAPLERSAEQQPQGLAPSPDESLAHAAQEVMGNTRVQAALSGAPGDGQAQSLLGDLCAASAGLDLGGLGGGSNQTMLRRFRAHQAGAEAVSVALGGDGAPLPEGVRLRMEAAFGHDFGHVRVHRGGAASAAARAVEAFAFTVGADIVFGEGQWGPETPAGERLLVHELTHVVQHDEGRVPRACGVEISQPSDTLEREATQNEQRLVGQVLPDAELSAWAGLEGLWTPDVQGAAPTPSPEGAAVQRSASGPQEEEQILAEPALDVVAVGAQVRYQVASPSSLQAPGAGVRYQWWCYNDPAQVRSPEVPARVEGPSTPTWDARWDLPGEHVLVCRVQEVSAEGVLGQARYLERRQRVAPLEALAARRFEAAVASDALTWRVQAELTHLALCQGGVPDHAQGDFPIHASGPNPATPAQAPGFHRQRYSVAPDAAPRLRWTVQVEGAATLPSEAFLGLRRVQGQDAFELGEGTSVALPIATPGVYTLRCEALDLDGAPRGPVARYRQVVLREEEAAEVERWRAHLARCDAAMEALDPQTRVGLRARWTGLTGDTADLVLFIGASAKDSARMELLDLTPGAPRLRYGGGDVEAALQDFERGNAYPQGRLLLELPENAQGLPPLRRTFVTRGASTWAEWAETSGWASLGLAALGVGAALAPGGQSVAAAFFVAAAGAGAASSGLSLYEQLHQAQVSASRVSLDLLGLASSLLGAGGAVRALRGQAALTLANRDGRFLLYGALVGDAGSAVLIAAESVAQLEAALSMEGSEAERVAAVVRVLANLALTGALLAVSARDVAAARARISNHVGAVDALPTPAVGALHLLDDAALIALKGASVAQLEVLAELTPLGAGLVSRLARLEGLALFSHRLERLSGGLLGVNGELDVHPRMLETITDPDLSSILVATREGDRATMTRFSRSGSYRLRFNFQLDQGEAFIQGVLGRLGLAGSGQAQALFGEMSRGERMRLFDLANRTYPGGVTTELPERATRYALGRKPETVRVFVEEFEMFCSEFDRVSAELKERVTAMAKEEAFGRDPQRTAEVILARPEFLGEEVTGFRNSYRSKVLQKISDDAVVGQAEFLAEALKGRVGASALGTSLTDRELIAAVRGVEVLTFGTESAAVYHANKHFRELPRAHVRPGRNPLDNYLESAAVTICTGEAHVSPTQAGGRKVEFTADFKWEDRVWPMRAIVHVSSAGDAVLATYSMRSKG